MAVQRRSWLNLPEGYGFLWILIYCRNDSFDGLEEVSGYDMSILLNYWIGFLVAGGIYWRNTTNILDTDIGLILGRVYCSYCSLLPFNEMYNMMGALCGCFTVKFDSSNILLSSVHTIFVITLRSVGL